MTVGNCNTTGEISLPTVIVVQGYRIRIGLEGRKAYPEGPHVSLMSRLAYLRSWRWAKELMAIYGGEIPAEVKIGRDLKILHRGFGTVIHAKTQIGDRVTIYHQVTIGRADAHLHGSLSTMDRVVVEDDVIIFPGAKILGQNGILTVARGSIVGANAVLTKSTKPYEIWAGVPAKLVSMRTMDR